MDWPTIVLGVLNAVIINFSERPLVWGPDLRQRPQTFTIPEPTMASPFEAYVTTVAVPVPLPTTEPRFGAPLFSGFFSWTTLLWILLFAFLAACGILAAVERAVAARPPPPVEVVHDPEPAEDDVEEVLPFFEPAVGESTASPDFMEMLALLVFACMAKDGGWSPEKLLERCEGFLMAFGRRYGFDSTTRHDPNAHSGRLSIKANKSPARPSSSSRRKFGDMVTLTGINTKPVILTPGLFLHVLYSIRRDFSVLPARRFTIRSAAPGIQRQSLRPSWSYLPAPAPPSPPVVYATAGSQTEGVPPEAPQVCHECETRAQLGDHAKAPSYTSTITQTELEKSIPTATLESIAFLLFDAQNTLKAKGTSVMVNGRIKDTRWRDFTCPLLETQILHDLDIYLRGLPATLEQFFKVVVSEFVERECNKRLLQNKTRAKMEKHEGMAPRVHWLDQWVDPEERKEWSEEVKSLVESRERESEENMMTREMLGPEDFEATLEDGKVVCKLPGMVHVGEKDDGVKEDTERREEDEKVSAMGTAVGAEESFPKDGKIDDSKFMREAENAKQAEADERERLRKEQAAAQAARRMRGGIGASKWAA